MNIRWFGQACFLVTSSTGARILMDPFGQGFGYPVPRVEAECVTISHSHVDHSNAEAVTGAPEILRAPGRWSIAGVELQGVQTYHDAVEGRKRGPNIVFRLEMDGLALCHSGDLGHPLDEARLAELGKVDILLLHVGGGFAQTVEEAVELRRRLGAAVTVPMHYRTPAMGLGGLFFKPVERFIAAAGEEPRRVRRLDREGVAEIDVDRTSLARMAGIAVLGYR